MRGNLKFGSISFRLKLNFQTSVKTECIHFSSIFFCKVIKKWNCSKLSNACILALFLCKVIKRWNRMFCAMRIHVYVYVLMGKSLSFSLSASSLYIYIKCVQIYSKCVPILFGEKNRISGAKCKFTYIPSLKLCRWILYD